MNIDEDANGSFKKLNFLLQNPPFLPETFSNLLLLYCKFGYYDLAADILAENSEYIDKMPNPSEFNFIDAIILQKASP
jgi:tetratricopeptide repeat protein 30